MLHFELATVEEICTELASRLREHRLAQNITQAELAGRAGISMGTVRNFESKGQATLESLIKIVMALGLAGSLSDLFVLRATTIRDMEKASVRRQRAGSAR
ncbi:MAG: helix-turn-helix domain-containing protein [Paraburkholderia sp.]|uniref:helix-turn-helix transcriptional regulator n=1 Tax=Paraburkholderia sp. TaxID=1926495 RepID=UPI00120DF301|nr:helix-turn-helix domain-containing protein [Paraburkholderia sp.]TAL96740.1 MAG: helix-turn-helix domain-containing protein [Paraburkholderia sp.]